MHASNFKLQTSSFFHVQTIDNCSSRICGYGGYARVSGDAGDDAGADVWRARDHAQAERLGVVVRPNALSWADETGKLFDVLRAAAEARNDLLRNQSSKPTTVDANTQIKAQAEKQRDQFGGANNYYEIEAAESATLTDQQRLALSDEIRAGKLYAFVEIPASVLAEDQAVGTAAKFVGQDALLSAGRQWLAAVVSEQVRVTRLNRLGLDPSVISLASRPIEFTPMAPIKPDSDGKERSQTDMLLQLFLPFGIMMLMFMVIFLAAQPMLESGMEEKSHRIAEVLLVVPVNSNSTYGRQIAGQRGGITDDLCHLRHRWLGRVATQRLGQANCRCR